MMDEHAGRSIATLILTDFVEWTYQNMDKVACLEWTKTT